MKKIPIVTVILVLVVGAGGFYAGMKYQESKRGQFSRQFAGQQGNHTNQFSQRSNLGLRPVTGEIIGSDDKSITVKLTDGSSKIILLSEKTEINKADKANVVDLKAGEKVAVFGSDNSDGSITAQSIQLNPRLSRMGGATQSATTN